MCILFTLHIIRNFVSPSLLLFSVSQIDFVYHTGRFVSCVNGRAVGHCCWCKKGIKTLREHIVMVVGDYSLSSKKIVTFSYMSKRLVAVSLLYAVSYYEANKKVLTTQ